jgi:hypothetical protein
VKHVLLTGMSATGTSAVVRELAVRLKGVLIVDGGRRPAPGRSPDSARLIWEAPVRGGAALSWRHGRAPARLRDDLAMSSTRTRLGGAGARGGLHSRRGCAGKPHPGRRRLTGIGELWPAGISRIIVSGIRREDVESHGQGVVADRVITRLRRA